MSRWWRAYDRALDDPKIQRLGPDLFKTWFNLMCLASQHGGTLPSIPDIAFRLRIAAVDEPADVAERRTRKLIDELIHCRLIDECDGALRPHDWDEWQYESDDAAARARKYRAKKRKTYKRIAPASQSAALHVTKCSVPEQNRTESDTDSEQNRTEKSDARSASPKDPRAELFSRGLSVLTSITGKTPNSCRSLVGRWLRDVGDEAIHVLGAIEEAERNRIADPVAWITRALKPKARLYGEPLKRGGSILDAIEQFQVRAEDGDDSPPNAGSVLSLPPR